MSDDFDYNQPAPAVDTKDSSGNSGGGGGSWDVQRLRPYGKQDEAIKNHLLVTMYSPARMRMFAGVVQENVRTWWMKLYVHFVSVEENGKKFGRQILCKKQTNSFYEKNYGSPLILQPATCGCGAQNQCFRVCLACGKDLGPRARDAEDPSCDRAAVAWADWKRAWEAILGPGNSGKRNDVKRNNEAQYKEWTKPGTDIRRHQDLASEYGASERYLLETMDLDKMMGRRTLGEGEPADPRFLPLLQGDKVFQALWGKHEARKAFYDPRQKLAIQITKSTKDGTRYAKYTIEDVNMPEIPDAWMPYLMAKESIPDYSDKAIVLGYEEHAQMAGLTATREIASPATQTQSPTPEVAPASAVAAPPPVVSAPPAVTAAPPPSVISAPPVISTPPTTVAQPPAAAPPRVGMSLPQPPRPTTVVAGPPSGPPPAATPPPMPGTPAGGSPPPPADTTSRQRRSW